MKGKLRKLKREIKPFLIAYLIIDIIFVGAFIVSLQGTEGLDSFKRMQKIFGDYFNNIITFKFLGAIFIDFICFIKSSFYTLIVFIILFIAWKIKFAKNNEYDGIEHGSSDWSKGGEEFDKLDDGREILNKKSGFILSKNHYLGTDLKKVIINKNILVVGRIWCR